MQIMPRLDIVASAILILSCFSGCGSHQKETALVSGKVTLDGKLLTSGAVLFVPQEGRAAKGAIQADGTYVLGTYRETDGATVGTHQVAVQAFINAKKGNSDPEAEFESLIPIHYTSPEQSNLSFVVEPGKSNVFNLELSSAAR